MNGDTYLLAGHRVHRVGFGAMQLPGPRVFGPPLDRQQALDVLRYAVAGGVDHIDTAQFYGPDVANELIQAALHPYPEGLVLVSKVGARRDDSGGIHEAQRPEQLREGVLANLASLQLDQVPVVNLRRHPEAGVPFDEQVAAMVAMTAPAVVATASRLGATTAQVALAWLLKQSPNLLLIPGTSSLAHLRENLVAAELELDAQAMDDIG
jgi:pyridoxine 4-dehydrogenase